MRPFTPPIRLSRLPAPRSYAATLFAASIAFVGACESKSPKPAPPAPADQKESASTGIVVDIGAAPAGNTPPVSISDALPLRLTLVAGNTPGLTIDDERRITSGEVAFKNSEMPDTRGLDHNLRVNRFAPGDGTVIVQVNITNGTKLGLAKLQPAIDLNGAPALVDHLGQRYSPIGYVCRDAISTRVRFRAEQPLNAITELPDAGPSVSRSDQEFVLVFRVTAHVKLSKFVVGTTQVCRFEPKAEVK